MKVALQLSTPFILTMDTNVFESNKLYRLLLIDRFRSMIWKKVQNSITSSRDDLKLHVWHRLKLIPSDLSG